MYFSDGHGAPRPRRSRTRRSSEQAAVRRADIRRTALCSRRENDLSTFRQRCCTIRETHYWPMTAEDRPCRRRWRLRSDLAGGEPAADRQSVRRMRGHRLPGPGPLPWACSGAEMSDVKLPRRGTVVAWTTPGLPRRAPRTPVRPARTSSHSGRSGPARRRSVPRAGSPRTTGQAAVRPGGRADHDPVHHRRRRQRGRHVRFQAGLEP